MHGSDTVSEQRAHRNVARRRGIELKSSRERSIYLSDETVPWGEHLLIPVVIPQGLNI